jgi:DNA-3-methyladenine glycosylase
LTPLELRALLDEDVLVAAEALIGAQLVKGEMRAQIVEAEAYRGSDDPASHAFRGPTPRNRVMYQGSGLAYVYFNYGVHWMLNVSIYQTGRPGGVLIRAAEPIAGLDQMSLNRPSERPEDLLSGPGKLTKAFGITGADNFIDLLDPSAPLHILPRSESPRIITGPRIGIAEGKGHLLPWRFLDADRLKWASKPRPSS